MPDITTNNTEPMASQAATATAEVPAATQQDSSSIPPRPVSQASMSSSPVFVSSRPASPRIRRPSSSLSLSSRRASLLSPPDPSLPQRLPRSGHPADAAAFAELHQELEAEQEAQVNRLLNIIRLQSLQAGVDGDATSNAATVDSSSTRGGGGGRMSRRGSNRLSRDGSFYRPRSISRASSPGLTPTGGGACDSASESSAWIGSGSGGAEFHAAESMMLKRENEMLKRRIRELEKMVAELGAKTEQPPAVPISSSEPDVAGPSSSLSS